ncbi:MAG: ATP-binding protein, partial [Clostridiales bacterium]|nr:ATP-binding protein [Clostridiales bacterium]
MSKIVGSNQELCVGCNRCTRECPIETANHTYQDGEDGGIKVNVNSDHCIACGACISVCKHGARFYTDDLQAFLDDLAAGEPVSVMVAPSVRTNFREWRSLLTWLKSLGAQKIYDVSLGADICVWAHLRYLEKHSPAALITQPCPSIVSYCELHRPELLPYLSPVHSPMGCAAVFMREYEGVSGRIAAISPCISKAVEFESTQLVQYNITFAKLQEYLQENDIKLPAEQGDFDHYECGPGVLFPLPGGLKENLEFFMGKKLRIDQSEGIPVYANLDKFALSEPRDLPQIFDVLNCAEGCSNGSGCVHDKNIFQIQAKMDVSRKAASAKQDLSYYRYLYEQYDEAFDLCHFMRGYSDAPAEKDTVSEAGIQRAFELLGKDTYAKQNFNCGACGSDSCRDMARKIALDINLPTNCIIKSRDNMQEEHEKNVEMYQRNASYLELIHDVGDNLLSMAEEDYGGAATASVEALRLTLNAHSAHIWKRMEDGKDRVSFHKLLGSASNHDNNPNVIFWDDVPEWFEQLEAGHHIACKRKDMSSQVLKQFPDPEVLSVFVAPVHIKGRFWGVISVKNKDERVFKEEEMAVVMATVILIVSSIIEKELTDSLLAATRAKSDFLSHMSHEMRTPMNAIIGMAEIASNTDDIAKLRYCLSTIGASSTHLLRLINDILDMSKIEAGKLELDNKPFNIEKMLLKICKIIFDRAEQKKQELEISLGRSIHMHYVGDELRLSQVITNLLSNALKFTPEGGGITLTADETSGEGDRRMLRFSVSDTGIGMSENQMARLFNAFDQTDSGVTKKFGGTGLGLAISKSIVEKMNGHIKVESVPGHGSSFTFEVELASHQPAQAAAIPLRILLATADAQEREYFSELAGRLGLNMDIAAGSAKTGQLVDGALKAGQPYDVLFVDHNLDARHGLDTIAGLDNQVDADSVVMMCPFLVWHKIEADAAALGVGRFISKPVFPSAIADAIN